MTCYRNRNNFKGLERTLEYPESTQLFRGNTTLLSATRVWEQTLVRLLKFILNVAGGGCLLCRSGLRIFKLFQSVT